MTEHKAQVPLAMAPLERISIELMANGWSCILLSIAARSWRHSQQRTPLLAP